MVHTRETRASASELKFVIQPSLGPRVREWARAHLAADPHGTGPFGDEYDTATLYFDTAGLDVFYRRKSFRRAKYRVRRYGSSDVVFLERKLRKPRLLIKRRTAAPIATLDHLRDAAPIPWGGEWFHRRLLLRGLQPVCQVSYHRTARVIETDDGLARLTLDCELHARPIDEPRFSADGGTVPFLPDRLILEVKYRVQLPGIFKRLVEEFALEPQSASKYRLGMTALGHQLAPGSKPVLTSTDASYA